MNRQLEELILYILEKVPRPLGRTSITKILYLIEYFHFQTVGRRATFLEFKREDFGPYDFAIVDLINEMVCAKRISVEDYPRPNGATGHRYYPADRCDITQILPSLMEIADGVLVDIREMGDDDLLDLVYSTPPMKRIRDMEITNNCFLSGQNIDLSISNYEIYRPTLDQIIEAERRLQTMEELGSDEEYSLHLREINEAMAPFRERANECFL